MSPGAWKRYPVTREGDKVDRCRDGSVWPHHEPGDARSVFLDVCLIHDVGNWLRRCHAVTRLALEALGK
jgi:hypothetical protein